VRRRKRTKKAPRSQPRRDAKVLMGILLKKRDELLDEDCRHKRAAMRDEREQRLRAMGFSDAAMVHVKTQDEADENEKIDAPIPHGVADAFLEQSSRHFHGVPEDATDKKQGRKRKGGTAPDPARYVPLPDN